MGGRRLRIVHKTSYEYENPVEVSFNELRMTPLTIDGQVLLGHELSVRPAGMIQSYVDYWGAHVEAFDVHSAHTSLEIISTSTVDTPPMRQPEVSGSWSDLAAPDVRNAFAEYLTFSEYVDHADADDERRQLVNQLASMASPEEAADAAMRAVRERMTYTPGVTSVFTTAAEAWAEGHGVCQDFSHVMLSLLRTVGIPARYVSGYLHTEDEAIGQEVVGESHAWVEFWAGDWHALDPTNDRAVGAAHVIVARGRDYSDVAPVSGIYAGGRNTRLDVSVTITQL